MAASLELVADTHTLLWMLFNPARLSSDARSALQVAEAAGALIHISAITVVELRYLVEKGTIPEADYQACITELRDPATAPTVKPLDLMTSEALSQIPRATVPDMPDRIIAATALALGLPLVTRDSQIRSLTNITAIW